MIPNAWTGFDFGLGEELDQLRQTVAGFAHDKIARVDIIADPVRLRDLHLGVFQ